jgi:glycine cleavage system aminomethyltransferase T
MGPDAARVAAEAGGGELNGLRYFEGGEAEIAGVHLHAVRLSYIGEAGWEITCKAENAGRIYDKLDSLGVQPAGVLAQSAMRIEKRFLAYVHDIDADTSPLQVGLDFAVAWDSDFLGKDALLAQRDAGEACRMATLLFEDGKAVPLGNEPIYVGEVLAGKTTSAAYGYRIGAPVALADLTLVEARADGTAVDVDIAGARFRCQVSSKPAFDPQGTRVRTPTPPPRL